MIEHQQLEKADISVYQVAKKGNWCSGDAFYTVRTNDYILCAVADGLGSGEEAMEAAAIAMNVIKEDHHLNLDTIMDHCNNVLWGTRGVVLTILKIDIHSNIIEYTNVGNIACTFYKPSGDMIRPLPSRGYLSGKRKAFKIQRIPYEKDMIFILYSDGLIFDPMYHTLFTKNETPERIIERVVSLMENSNDDTTILVGKVK